MLNLNLERIIKYLEYDKEDLMSLSLQDVIDLDKQSNIAERDAIYLENLSIKDQFQKMFKKYDMLCELFGAEYVDKYLLRYKLSEITQERDMIRRGNGDKVTPYGNSDDYIFLRTEKKDKVIPPARSKKTRVTCDIYMVPSEYQGLKHSEIIEKIFTEKYLWMSEFKYNVYELNSADSNFYVSVPEKDSLYISMKHFVAGDVDSIKQSNYHRFGDALYNNEYILNFLNCVKGNAKEVNKNDGEICS